MSEQRKTPVEFLAERLEYFVWMRDIDEISAQNAGKWLDKFLAEAKEQEKNHIIAAYDAGRIGGFYGTTEDGEEFYKKNYDDITRKVEEGD